MGKKASFLPKGDMDKFLVCNADESEPGTFKDRELMQKTPHTLIEGVAISAYAVGANRAYIYIRGEYEMQATILEDALVEAKAAGYLGDRIFGSDFSLELWVHRGAGAYICGEETALLDSLEGKRGNPRLKPPFPAINGLYQGPTLINNVETLMNAPHILRMGGAEYAKIGTETSTGTKVVSVSGCVRRPGNYEIVLGVPSRHIIEDLAGGAPEGRSIKACSPAARARPCCPATMSSSTCPTTSTRLPRPGSMLGSGAIIVIDDSIPIVDVRPQDRRSSTATSPAASAPPCREGTNWTVKMLERIETGEATPMDLDIMASSASRSWATACACSATRWRCRSAR
jgi:NADH-quinone oxidoreductase subunit F